MDPSNEVEAASAAPLPGPHLTLAEIIQAYPDQHVILGNVDFDRTRMELRGGVVIGHSRSRKEAIAMAEPYRPVGCHTAFYFTGKIRAYR